MLSQGQATARAAIGCFLGCALFLVIEPSAGLMLTLAVVSLTIIAVTWASYR